MSDFCEVLRAHGARWPRLTPQDAVKLLIQHSCGCEHLIACPDEALSRVKEEYEDVPAACGPLFEPIGGGWARLHLSAAKEQGISSELVGRMFLASAALNPQAADPQKMVRAMDELKTMTWQGIFDGFDLPELEQYLKSWSGGPVSHSETYRQAYHPAYRVVDARLKEMLPLLCEIEQKKPRTVAIDGRSASGKTTAAAFAEKIFGYGVVHTDDFFLPAALRTAERLAQPGGNLHYERFEQEVLAALPTGQSFSYGVYDCAEQKITHCRQVDARVGVLIEGAYCQRPQFGNPYDLTVFYDIDPEQQRLRILRRNGPEAAKRFEALWVPLENRYHTACHTKENAQLTLKAENN